jgi:hypothetical protein
MGKILLTFFLFLLYIFPGRGQSNMTLDRDFLQPFQSDFNDVSCNVFTSIMPYDKEKTEDATRHDSVAKYNDFIFKNGDHLFTDGLLEATIFPLAGGSTGYDAYGKTAIYDYSGGLHLDGKLGKKFSFSGNYLGGDIVGASFIDSIIKRYKVVPGVGYAYGSPSKGYSYQYWDGYLSYNLNNNFNLQIGKGKQFWGDGYRSLFLSDVSTSYPYFKITVNIWKIQFVSLATVMQDAETPTGLTESFYTKYSSFQYLSWNASPRFNFSIFEAITYDGDSGKNVRGPDPGYLNPVLFYQSENYNIGDPDKSNLGAAFKIKVARHEQFYGQLLIDEFKLQNVIHHNGWWANKQGVQAGFKAFDLFKLKNLSFQTEIDYVRPYTYTARDPLQNYSNFNQPLADPEGANFIESASFLTYYHKNFLIQGSLVAYYYGGDKNGSDYGENIFINYNDHPNNYGNYVGQGVSIYLATAGIKSDFIISPLMNLKAELGIYEIIDKVGASETSEPYITLGVKTSLGNLYSDFR